MCALGNQYNSFQLSEQNKKGTHGQHSQTHPTRPHAFQSGFITIDTVDLALCVVKSWRVEIHIHSLCLCPPHTPREGQGCELMVK